MAKPMHEFGGWLAFFYITLWIGLISLALAILMMVPGLSGYWADVGYFLSFFIDCGLRGFLMYQIIKVTKKQEAATPNKIVRFVAYIVLALCLLAVPKIYFARLVYGVPGVNRIIVASIGLVLWFFIWTVYFRKSKRVLAYYGKNADKLF